MAVKYSRASGNWTSAGTWGAVDSTSYLNSESANTLLTTSYQLSSTFTPGTIQIDGVAVKLAFRAVSPTGTITIALDQSGDVAGTVVSINVADLPVAVTADQNGGWVFFKFASPVTLGAGAYSIKARTSSSSQVNLFSSSGTNWSRCLVTTTTGAPGAGDDVIIAGEYTGAGTSNSFTVTMDQTSLSTDYGGSGATNVNPAIAVYSKGIFTWGTTAATDYKLKVSGHIVVGSGGTWNSGTTGTPCPRGGSQELLIDCTTNVEFGFYALNLSNVNGQALSRSSGKVFEVCKLSANASANATTLNVDTDTGWLSGDEIAIASTSRTPGECEAGTLNGNAGASSLTVNGFAGSGGGIQYAHDGTAPTQARIILMTRSILWRGASASLQTFIDIRATANVDFDWVRFKWMGSATTNRTGIDINTTTGTCSFHYCHRDNSTVVGTIGWNLKQTSGTGCTLSHNTSFNIAGVHLNVAANSGGSVIDSNICMRNTDNAQVIFLGDVGGTFTNNVAIGAGLNANISIAESGGTIGTMSGNECHSGGTTGWNHSQPCYGIISNLKSWRNGGVGVLFFGGEVDYQNLEVFGNTATNISVNGSGGFYRGSNWTISGDATFATANGFNLSSGQGFTMILMNSNIGVAAGSGGNARTAHTTDFNLLAASMPFFTLINTNLGSSTEVTGQANMIPSGYIAMQKHDQTSGSNKTLKRFGTITRETTTVHTGSQSMKMTPLHASNKLESGSFLVPVNSGQTVTPTVYVYEDASYNGTRARLILKRNDALGIAADYVVDTATNASDAAWEALTGSTASAFTGGTASEDGVLEFVIDCDGTAGNLFVDSFSVA